MKKLIIYGGKIPVFHKIIQPIIHQIIQPVITFEIQPLHNITIKPIIINETLPNIDEEIQRLNLSINEQNKQETFETLKREKKIEQEVVIKDIRKEVTPSTENINKIKSLLNEGQKPNLTQPLIKAGNHDSSFEIQPYIMIVEQHITQTIIQTITEREIRAIKKFENKIYISGKNGDVFPYEKINKNNSEIMETIVAVNFIFLNQNINFPMAFKKTDIFAKAEKKLFKEYPELKSKQIYFIANGNVVDKSLTFEQNKIRSGNTILIKEIE